MWVALRHLNVVHSVKSPDLLISLLGGAAQWDTGEGGARSETPVLLISRGNSGERLLDSLLTPLRWLFWEETVQRSPAGDRECLDVIFPRLGKNSCQQLASTREGVTEDALHLSSLQRDCIHTHMFTSTYIHTHKKKYIYIYVYK